MCKRFFLLPLLIVTSLLTSCSQQHMSSSLLNDSGLILAAHYRTPVEGLGFEIVYYPGEQLYVNVLNRSAYTVVFGCEAYIYKEETSGEWRRWIEADDVHNYDTPPSSGMPMIEQSVQAGTDKNHCMYFNQCNYSLTEGKYRVDIKNCRMYSESDMQGSLCDTIEEINLFFEI